LRDYRFYKNDLVHPNETAINFIFNKFCDSFLDDLSKKIKAEIKKVLSAVNHKPFFKESLEYQKFIAAQLKNIHKIETEYPFINLSIERNYFINKK
jgi:hypothetical protein